MVCLNSILFGMMLFKLEDNDLPGLTSSLFSICPSLQQETIDELFCCAIRAQKMDFIEFLWMVGADVNKSSKRFTGECPLSLATRTGNIAIVKLLLRNKDIDLSQFVLDGDPLWRLCRIANMDPKEQNEILNLFLKRGVIIDRTYMTIVPSSLLSTLHLFNPCNDESYRLLYNATQLLKEAEAGKISAETVKKLGPALNGKRQKDKKTALQIAIEKEDTNGIQLLNDAYVKFEIELEDGESIKPQKKKA